MATSSRERMILSAAVLMREHGLAGTSFREVLAHSGAPRGSIYHHFPGGKNQLVEEAVRAAGDFGGAMISVGATRSDPIAALRGFLRSWRMVLEESDFRAGCPVVAAATAASVEEPRLTAAASAAFTQWQDALAQILRDAGVSSARARRLATMTVAGVEGAVVLARAERSTRPLRDVGTELEALLKAALDR